MFGKLFSKRKEDLVAPTKVEPVTPRKEDPVVAALAQPLKRKLSDREIAIMDIRNEKRQQYELEREQLGLKKDLLLEKKSHLESKLAGIDVELQLLDKHLEDQVRKEEQASLKNKTFVKELKNRLEIKSPRWGFNPDTGEIIE